MHTTKHYVKNFNKIALAVTLLILVITSAAYTRFASAVTFDDFNFSGLNSSDENRNDFWPAANEILYWESAKSPTGDLNNIDPSTIQKVNNQSFINDPNSVIRPIINNTNKACFFVGGMSLVNAGNPFYEQTSSLRFTINQTSGQGSGAWIPVGTFFEDNSTASKDVYFIAHFICTEQHLTNDIENDDIILASKPISINSEKATTTIGELGTTTTDKHVFNSGNISSVEDTLPNLFGRDTGIAKADANTAQNTRIYEHFISYSNHKNAKLSLSLLNYNKLPQNWTLSLQPSNLTLGANQSSHIDLVAHTPTAGSLIYAIVTRIGSSITSISEPSIIIADNPPFASTKECYDLQVGNRFYPLQCSISNGIIADKGVALFRNNQTLAIKLIPFGQGVLKLILPKVLIDSSSQLGVFEDGKRITTTLENNTDFFRILLVPFNGKTSVVSINGTEINPSAIDQLPILVRETNLATLINNNNNNINPPSPPTASPTGGTYTIPVDVTLTSSQPNTVIYYTTDGSDPTTSSKRHQYSSQIHLTQITTLLFIAYDKVNKVPSSIQKETYII